MSMQGIRPGRWFAALACVLALGAAQARSPGGGHEQQFQQAVQLYKEGRYSAAFGRFAMLANKGDADAAHIALFMNKFGPTLYGAWWDADPTDVSDWASLIREPGGRMQPVFVPDPYALPARKRQAVFKVGPAEARAR